MTTQEQQYDFSTTLTQSQVHDLRQQINQFISNQQQAFVRPICLVSSGGTAVDLEVNSVRCLDNFSTGLRGAISVEEFLRRGYSVIHLQREGSASPFARILSSHLGLKQSNYGLTTECLGKLFVNPGEHDEDDLLLSVLHEEKDPFMTTVERTPFSIDTATMHRSDVILHRTLSNSTTLRKALKERSDAVIQKRLLTLPFRTVEEYLAMLQICAESLSSVKSLSMFFLAAAVSDFYVPMLEKSIHKIQSGAHEDGLTLHLQPVPKALKILRDTWAPESFVVSFKLETDINILRHKSMSAVEKYGCHMVIGNLLQSRHKKVWILAPESYQVQFPLDESNWQFTEVANDKSSSSMDELETKIIDVVVQSHFEFISYHYKCNGRDYSSLIHSKDNYALEKKKRERDIFWNKAKGFGLEVLGAILTFWISYTINTAVQRRYQRLHSEK